MERKYTVCLVGADNMAPEVRIKAEIRYINELERWLGGASGVERALELAVAAWEAWDHAGGSDYYAAIEHGEVPDRPMPPKPGASELDAAREAANLAVRSEISLPEDAYFQVAAFEPMRDPAYQELLITASKCKLSVPAPQLCAFADKIAALCAAAADKGGDKASMVTAVAGYAERATPEARQLAALLTERCISIAAHHNPDHDEGAGTEIRAYFDVVSSFADA